VRLPAVVVTGLQELLLIGVKGVMEPLLFWRRRLLVLSEEAGI